MDSNERWPIHMPHPMDAGRSACGLDITPGADQRSTIDKDSVTCQDCLGVDLEPAVAHPRAQRPSVLEPSTDAYALNTWEWGPAVWEVARLEASFPVAGYGPHREVELWRNAHGARCAYDVHRGAARPVVIWASQGPELDRDVRAAAVSYALALADLAAA